MVSSSQARQRARWSRNLRPVGWTLLAAVWMSQTGLAQVPAWDLVQALPAAALVTSQQAGTPAMLHIVILDGEDALNNIRDRTAREPIVQVEDENHKPVAGALILFTIHDGTSGAGAAVNGVTSLSVTTDATGRATLKGFQNNGVAGSFTIEVLATLGALTATTTIHESNGTPSAANADNSSSAGSTVERAGPGGIKHGKYLAAAAVAGVVVAIFFGVRSHSTSITAGSGSVHP